MLSGDEESSSGQWKSGDFMKRTGVQNWIRKYQLDWGLGCDQCVKITGERLQRQSLRISLRRGLVRFYCRRR